MFETVKLYRAYYYYYYCFQRFLWPAYLLEITPGYGGSATGIRKKNFAKLFTGKMPFLPVTKATLQCQRLKRTSVKYWISPRVIQNN